MNLKTIVCSCALATAAGPLSAVVVTNAWLLSEGGSVTNLANWSYFEGMANPSFDWWAKYPYSFGFLDLRKMADGGTLLADTNVRFDGFWVAPCEGEASATTRVARAATDVTWKAEPRSVFHVEDGATLVMESTMAPWTAGGVVRKTGGGAAVFQNAINESRIDVREGLCEYLFNWDNEYFQNAFTVNGAGEDALRFSRGNASVMRVGRVVDPYGRTETPDLLGGTIWFGPGQSSPASPGTNGWIGSRAAGLLRLARPPSGATGLALEDGDAVVDALPSEWAAWNCVGRWRFEIPDRPGADSGPWGNELVANGALPVVTNDAERGQVAWFDGNAGLKGFWRDDAADGLVNQPCGREPYTFAAWVKVREEDFGSSWKLAVFKFGNLVEAQCSTLGIHKDHVHQQHGGALTHDFNVPGGKPADGVWHHVAVVFDGAAQMSYYWDGELCDTADWTGKVATNLKAQEFLLGSAWSASAQNFHGMMDDVAFFRSALSAADVAALRDATAAPQALAADQEFSFTGAGRMHVFGEQRIDRLGSGADDCARGGFELDGASSKLVLDSDAESPTRAWTAWDGTIAGAGAVVKDGARGELVMTGVGGWRGATEIRAGTVRLRGTGSDLVAHWTFDDPRHPYANMAQRGFDLTAGNALKVAVVEDPERGRVLKLSADGKSAGGYLQAEYPAHFAYSNSAFSLALWVKVSSTAPNGGTFAVWGRDGVGGEQLQFRMWGAYDKLAYSFYNANHAAHVPALNDDAWHHLAITRTEDDVLATYVDGAAVSMDFAEHCAVTIPRNGKVMLGTCWLRENERYLDGCMDDVRIYQRALTAQEVAALAQDDADPAVGPARDVAPDELPAPLAHWSYDDPDDIGRDDTGNGHDLSVSGTGLSAEPSPVRGRMARFADASTGLVYDRDGATFPSGLPSGADDLTFTTWFRADEADRLNDTAALVYWGPSYMGGKAFIVDVEAEGRSIRFITLATNLVGGATQAVSVRAARDAFRRGSDRQRLHHLAAVQDSSAREFRIYLDGRFVMRSKIPDNHATASEAENFSLGRRIGMAGWKGVMDETKIYGAALTDAQILRAMRLEMESDALSHALPADATPVVSEGAALVLEGRDQTLAGVAGAGRLAVDAGALTLTGESSFGGTVAGAGAIALTPGASFAADGVGAFTGTLELRGGRTETAWPNADAAIPDGTTLPVASAPYAAVGGRLVVGEAVCVARTDGAWTGGAYELATAGEIVLSGAAAEGCTVQPGLKSGWKAKLVARANAAGTQTLYLHVLPSSTLIILR